MGLLDVFFLNLAASAALFLWQSWEGAITPDPNYAPALRPRRLRPRFGVQEAANQAAAIARLHSIARRTMATAPLTLESSASYVLSMYINSRTVT